MLAPSCAMRTMRMSHDEERARARMQNGRDRSPAHWLNRIGSLPSIKFVNPNAR